MTEFKIGDRVRVRDLPEVGFYAGRFGTVVGVRRTRDDVPWGYLVKLDAGLPGNRADDIGISFAPGELEPKTSSTP